MTLIQEIAQNAGTTEAEARAVLRALVDTHWGSAEEAGPTVVSISKNLIRKCALEERND